MNNQIEMKQIKGIFLPKYYLTKDGKVYDIQKDSYLSFYSQYSYRLRTTQNTYKSISLKKLYRQLYNKQFCIDTIENLQGQEWREIQETNGVYYVSNYGRVKSYKKYYATILKPMKNKGGYLRVQIFFNGIMRNMLISRLVAGAFMEQPKNISMYQLHHINRNRQDNRLENLIWLRVDNHKSIHTVYKFLDKYNED